MSRHLLFNPVGMAPARGFSYGSMPGSGRLLYVAGMTGHNEEEDIAEGIVEQFAAACTSVVRVVQEAGGSAEDVISMTIYTSAMDDYRKNLRAIGVSYRREFGKHFPPMALIGVSELFDPRALVELVCVAVVPDGTE
jgi:enamine deaminase RidA (YjgF/YER057c/UK114 family)